MDAILLTLAFGLALTFAFWLLFRWVGSIIDAVPPEDRAWRDPPPLYWRLMGFPAHAVAVWIGSWLPPGMRRRTADRLRQAGLEHALTVDQFVAGQVIGAMLALAVLALVTAGLNSLSSLAWPVAALVGAIMPITWLRDRIERRTRRIAKALPFYLDIVTLAIEAGTNMTGALQHAVEKGPQGPMAEELQRVLRDIRAGRTRAESLRMMAERLRMPAISNWVAAVLAADRQGSSLGPILRAQAEQRRTERFLRAEALALKAPVKMLFPLMTCIFPCTFIVVFFPIVVRIIEEGVLG
jgi:tight adherence protein C